MNVCHKLRFYTWMPFSRITKKNNIFGGCISSFISRSIKIKNTGQATAAPYQSSQYAAVYKENFKKKGERMYFKCVRKDQNGAQFGIQLRTPPFSRRYQSSSTPSQEVTVSLGQPPPSPLLTHFVDDFTRSQASVGGCGGLGSSPTQIWLKI